MLRRIEKKRGNSDALAHINLASPFGEVGYYHYTSLETLCHIITLSS